MLFDGSLRPGDRLPAERELALQLGIGRPALREALRALEANGLIILRKGKSGGAFISEGQSGVFSESMSDMLRLSQVSVDQLFEARLWFQTAVARAACQRATKKDIQRLRDNVEQGEALHAQGLERERIEHNIDFHVILAEMTRNPVAVMVIRGLTDSLKALIRQIGSRPISTLFRDRLKLVEALERKDEDAAAGAMEWILKSTRRSYKDLEERKLPSVAQPLAVLEAIPLATTSKRRYVRSAK
jgi:DNA-binding FadR family transcriptional regulator